MGRRLALLIATYAYEDAELSRLVTPAHDTEALGEVLRDTEIAGFDVTTLINEPHHRVGQAIADLYRDRRRDDLTLLYFTGHGLKDDEGRLYLTTSNTRRDSLLFTSLPAEQIDQAMSSCMSRQKVLILDCCYSGAFPAKLSHKGSTDVHALDRFRGSGRTVLTASDATQYSYERERDGAAAPRSVFTHHLVAGLREGAADLDGDGDITLDELYSYVHDKVIDETPQQRPKKHDSIEGRIVIARNTNWELPTHLQHSLRSPLAGDRRVAVDGLGHLHQIGNSHVRGCVTEELRRLVDDDSRTVSLAATEQLRAIDVGAADAAGTERGSETADTARAPAAPAAPDVPAPARPAASEAPREPEPAPEPALAPAYEPKPEPEPESEPKPELEPEPKPEPERETLGEKGAVPEARPGLPGREAETDAAPRAGPARPSRRTVLLAGVGGLAAIGAVAPTVIALVSSDDGSDGREESMSPREVALRSVTTVKAERGGKSATAAGFVYDHQGHVVTVPLAVDGDAVGGDTSFSLTLPSGERLDAVLVGQAVDHAVAVYRATSRPGDLPPPLATSDVPAAYALKTVLTAVWGGQGAGAGASTGTVTKLTHTVSGSLGKTSGDGSGDTSADRPVMLSTFRTDIPLRRARMGAPLIGRDGRVVGMEVGGAVLAEEDKVDALPIRHVKRVADELILTGKASHGVIGAAVETGTGQARIADKQTDGSAAITPGGPADKAGLKSGDVIVEFGGVDVASGSDLIARIYAYRPGATLPLVYRRDGKKKEETLTLERHDGSG